MKILSRTLTLSAVLTLAAVGASPAAMLLEYKFDGNGNNTGVTGGNNITISGAGTGTPTYNGPAAPFSSGSSLNNTSLTYNVAGQTANLGNFSSSGPNSVSTGFTISGWMNTTAAGGSSAKILDKGGTAAGGLTLQFAGNNLNLQIGTGTDLLSGTSSGFNFAQLNTWVWFGTTYDATSGTISFYSLDNSNQVYLVSSAVTAGGNYVNNSVQMRLGNSSAGTRVVDGYIDDFRFFNNVESVSQMQALVPEPNAVSLAGVGLLFGLWKMRRTKRHEINRVSHS